MLKDKAPIHINMMRSSSFHAVLPLAPPKKSKPIHTIKAELMLFIFVSLNYITPRADGLDLSFAFAMLSLVTFEIISTLTIIVRFLYQ